MHGYNQPGARRRHRPETASVNLFATAGLTTNPDPSSSASLSSGSLLRNSVSAPKFSVSGLLTNNSSPSRTPERKRTPPPRPPDSSFTPPPPPSGSSFGAADFSSGGAGSFASSSPSAVGEMPCRERTAEFRTAAKSMQMKQQAMNGYAGPKPKKKLVAEAVQFNHMARRIGKDLTQTFIKMEKLSMLAKKRSIFDDRVSEIEELTQIIKQDIAGLNQQIGSLQEFAKGRQLGVAEPGGDSLRWRQHSRCVVVGLQSRLAHMSTEYKSVLEERTENMKQQNSRRKEYSSPDAIPSSLPPSASNGNLGSVLLSDEYGAGGSSGGGGGSVALEMDPLLEQRRAQSQLQLIDEQESYVRARSSAMENIESSIVELGQIFRQLAHLVSEQGETIQRIDSNVEETAVNVEAAHMELLKYFRSISQNRWLMIKVFGVLVLMFIIFIVFMV